MLTVKIEGIAGLQAKLSQLKESLQGPAMQAAINKTAEKAQAEINRAIREEYVVKADEVRNSMTMRRASKGRLEAVIQIFGSKNRRGRSLNMIHFAEKFVTMGQARKRTKAGEGGTQTLRNGGQVQKALQLRFMVKRGVGKKMILGAFIGNKGRTIFIREGAARLPIKPLQVIGFSQMFSSKKISSRVLEKINADLPVEVDRAIKAMIARFGR